MDSDQFARFSERIEKVESCWIFKPYIDHGRYRVFTVNGRSYPAHRLAYVYFYKRIDPDKMICHRCNDKRCVNPNHLYEGTAQDNAKDRGMARRTESPSGDGEGKRFASLPSQLPVGMTEYEYKRKIKTVAYTLNLTLQEFVTMAILSQINKESNHE
jgi:hypothetical protein